MSMQKLKILTPLHQSLRRPSQLVEFPLSQQTRRQIHSLKTHFRASLPMIKTLGLAAPQIAVQKQFFIMPVSTSYPQVLQSNSRVLKSLVRNFVVYINPKFIPLQNQETQTAPQFCLSIPTQIYHVARYKSIKSEYFDENGNKIEKLMNGMKARVFQHEYDHLQGIMMDIKGQKEPLSQQQRNQLNIQQLIKTFNQYNYDI